MANAPGVALSYRDFDLKLDKAETFFIEVLDSPVGRRTRAQPLILPEAELPEWRSSIKSRKKDREIYKRMGQALFEALFPRSILSIWSRSEQTLDLDSSSTLRLRLDIRCPELAEIPWEILYDGDGHYHLAQDERHPIVRYLVDSGDFHLLERPRALNILIVAAAPNGWPKLPGLGVEIDDFRNHLEKTPHVGTVQFVERATLDKLNKELENEYHILHYVGHAEFESGRGSLILEDDHGNPDKVDADTLGTYFRNTPLQLLVLNGCETALLSAGDPVKGFANAATSAGVPAVIAMQDKVFDRKAVAFSREFYRVLMQGATLEKAMTKARQAVIRCASPDLPDWAIPVLFTNVKQGFLWGDGNAFQPAPGLDSADPFASEAASSASLVEESARGVQGESRTHEERAIVAGGGLLSISQPPDKSGGSLAIPEASDKLLLDRADHEIWHNLTRAEYPCFIDRKEELQLIKNALASNASSSLISISGLGGVGKSALAHELAAQLLNERSFEAIIWISGWRPVQSIQNSADDSDKVLSTFDDVYQTIALVLRKPTMLKALPEERCSVLQNFLSEGHYLLIIDDADEIQDDKFEQLIKTLPTPTRAVLTSRSPLKLEAIQLSLAGFDQSTAREYLFAEAGAMQIPLLGAASETELAMLIEESCGLPQVLNWALQQLRDQKQSVTAVVSQLRDEVGDQSLADFCLRKSFQKLDPDQQRLLFAMAVFAQPVLGEAAGRIANLFGEEFDQACDRLLQLRLIQIDTKGDHYGVMSFVRRYTLKKLDEDPSLKRDLLLRAVDQFREFAQANGDIGDWVAHDRLETEMPNLMWATRQAYDLGEWQRVLDFRAALSDFFNMRGYYSQAIDVGTLAYKAAGNLGNLEEAGWCAIYPLAQSYFHQDMYEEAEAWCREGLKAFEESRNERGQVHAQRYLGRIRQALGDFDSAKRLFTDGLNLALRSSESRRDRDRQTDLLASLAGLAEAQHDYAGASSSYLTALNQYQATRNTTGAAAMYHQLGNIALLHDDYDQAEKYLDASLAALKGTKWLRRKAQVISSLALLAEKRGDLFKAYELQLIVREKFKTLSAALELAHADAAIARIQANLEYERNERAADAT